MSDLQKVHPAADLANLPAARPVRRLPRAVAATVALSMAAVAGFGAAALDAASVSAAPAPKMTVHHIAPNGTSWAAKR